MKKIILLLAIFFLVGLGFAQMTPDQFRKIVSAEGDSVPLLSQLSAIPLWTNATVSNLMKYASGKVFKEEMLQTSRTVGGKYVVFTCQSKFYQQSISSILTYDEKASAVKVYGLYGEVVTEGTVVYDYEKKIYAITSNYGEDFKEIIVGSYSDTESSDRTLVYKAGVLFMTREVKSHPIAAKK